MFMRLSILFVVLTPSVAFAQLPVVQPSQAGISAEGIKNLTAYLQDLVDEDQVSGGVIMMARDDKVVVHKAVGMLDREDGTAMPKDAIFRIASMTKPITSVGIMMLVEEGKLKLDDPVSKYLPEFKNQKVLVNPEQLTTEAARREISVRDLMCHTSGLTYAGHPVLGPLHVKAGISVGVYTEPKSTKEMTERLAAIPLAFHPGQQWHYGMSTDVLGRLIEVVSQMPFDQFLEKRIFQPLGMSDTYFHVPAAKKSRIASLYYFDEEGKLQQLPDGKTYVLPGINSRIDADYPYSEKHKYLSGGGGLCSTASDYMRFCLMLLNKGTFNGNQLLRADTVALMTQNQLGGLTDAFNSQPGWDDQSVGFGLGFLVVMDDPKYKDLVGSYQWGGAFSTSFCIVPAKDWALVVLVQTAWNDKSLAWAEEFKRRAARAVVK